jgi:hypothetical protein
MAGGDDKKQLQDMRADIDGLVTDTKMIREQVDSMVLTHFLARPVGRD